MKNTFFIGVLSLLLFSCGGPSTDSTESTSTAEADTTQWTSYGEPIEDITSLIPATEVAHLMETEGQAMGIFEAEIVQSCMTMGCWMSIKGPTEDTVLVFMKDHAFFVPKDGVQGKRALFSGEAFYDTLSVDLQKHLLEDAGAEQSAIDAVTESAYELAFEASGVWIADVPEDAPMAGDEME
ncbi:MAG: DUF4920 domain-containing protein [Flavobacteriales bacterium]